MENKRNFFLTLSGAILAVSVIIVIVAVLRNKSSVIPGLSKNDILKRSIVSNPFGKLEQFKTDDEFVSYMQQNSATGYFGGGVGFSESFEMKTAPRATLDRSNLLVPQMGSDVAERVSQTNVQVLGIDEPDVIKTDGTNLFYSTPYVYYRSGNPVPLMEKQSANPADVADMTVRSDEVPSVGRIMPPDEMPQKPTGGVASIKVFPPKSMEKTATVQASGDLLLTKNTLIIFDESNYPKREIAAYDVTDASRPKKKWSIPYAQNTYKVQARLYRDKLYLVTRLIVDGAPVCPLPLFDTKKTGTSIRCADVYHPVTPVSDDTVYTVSVINTANGDIEKNASFTGSTSEAVIYMSKDALYLTYYYSGDIAKIMYGFVIQNTDLFPASVVDKLAKLQEYDISQQSKLNEVTSLLSRFMAIMDKDKRLETENNMQNRMKKYMADNARELGKTGIVKIHIDNLDIDTTGEVPGKVLNQFSLDSYKDHLRIATTIGQNSWFGNFGRLTESFSDVYVLDSRLRVTGFVKDLGKTEQIYSVRFMADRAYVVTFRQTDPFYVIDLSKPNTPELKGELKIPGYSSYLHPLTTDIILGIGKDSDKVKLSLFDVSNPENPQETDTFIMDEYWSEALDNHHAFLADEKHEVFFLPGTKGGYVFSYKGNKLNMVKAVSDFEVQRAIYINNYLYIIGQQSIVALDENNWQRIGELDLMQ
ncbi:MAG: beta-propeller domain-containing protein [Patescibacteria group bacterium]